MFICVHLSSSVVKKIYLTEKAIPYNVILTQQVFLFYLIPVAINSVSTGKCSDPIAGNTLVEREPQSLEYQI